MKAQKQFLRKRAIAKKGYPEGLLKLVHGVAINGLWGLDPNCDF
jgi:hypothetical protein